MRGLWVSEQLAAVPEFQGLGPLFKSSPEPVALTESETEYVIRCTKHTFTDHMVFQVSGEGLPWRPGAPTPSGWSLVRCRVCLQLLCVESLTQGLCGSHVPTWRQGIWAGSLGQDSGWPWGERPPLQLKGAHTPQLSISAPLLLGPV